MLTQRSSHSVRSMINIDSCQAQARGYVAKLQDYHRVRGGCCKKCAQKEYVGKLQHDDTPVSAVQLY